jgi:hypothetical protein
MVSLVSTNILYCATNFTDITYITPADTQSALGPSRSLSTKCLTPVAQAHDDAI